MIRRTMRLLPLLALVMASFLGLSAGASRAESMKADLSHRAIRITSNFTGSQIVVFGMIERDNATVSRGEPYDLIIVVRGKDETLISRRKDRIAGIWINNKKRTYRNAPNFYALSSTRKLEDIASPNVLAKYQLGTDYLLLPENSTPGARTGQKDDFREAALRLRREGGLYRDDLSSIVFLNQSLFRSTVDIPADVAVGKYDVTLYLFRGGVLLDQISEPMTISKYGFEQVTYAMAQNNSLIYGLIAVLIAILTGWFIGIVFRKN